MIDDIVLPVLFMVFGGLSGYLLTMGYVYRVVTRLRRKRMERGPLCRDPYFDALIDVVRNTGGEWL